MIISNADIPREFVDSDSDLVVEDLPFEGLPFEELSRVDLGEQTNAELGKRYFEPGEQMQIVCIVAGLKVWIFRDSRMASYHVAFGETPTPFDQCEWMSREEAGRFVIAKVKELT